MLLQVCFDEGPCVYQAEKKEMALRVEKKMIYTEVWLFSSYIPFVYFESGVILHEKHRPISAITALEGRGSRKF